MQLRRLTPALIAIAGLSVLGACGDTDEDGDDAATDETSEGATDSGETDGAEVAGGSLEFIALDIAWDPAEASASPGELDVTLVNEGELEHTWLVEDHEDELKLEVTENGDTDQGTITLESGSYTYYCDVPGHRAAGMEGSLLLE